MKNYQEKSAAAIQAVAPAIKDLDAEAQKAAIAQVGKPSQWTLNLLWLIFVPGLFGLIVLFTVYAFELTNDGKTETDPAIFVEALTFALGALVGLFVPSPRTGTGSGGG